MDIQTGDIILVRGQTPIISRLVRKFTDSEYTHVGIAVTPEHIYEIDLCKKLAIRKNTHKDFDVYRYTGYLDDDMKSKMGKLAIKKSLNNEGYDWLRIIGFALEKVFRINRVYDEVNKVVCSEIVDYIYSGVGIDLVPNREDGAVTPGHLAKSPYLTKVYSSSNNPL